MKSIKKIKIAVFVRVIKTLSDHGYISFEHFSLLNSGLLVFLG